nr:hypothetical protein [Pacificibacter marinus]
MGHGFAFTNTYIGVAIALGHPLSMSGIRITGVAMLDLKSAAKAALKKLHRWQVWSFF